MTCVMQKPALNPNTCYYRPEPVLKAEVTQITACSFAGPIFRILKIRWKLWTIPCGRQVYYVKIEESLSEQMAHSNVDLHLKEISEFLHGSVMNKTSHSNDP